MMDFIQWLFMIVVVTRLPITNSQQLRPVLPGSSRDSKIIRFLGNSFIRYDFGVLTAEMLSPSNKESLALQFVTDDEEGLIWLFEGPGKDKIHLSVKDGKLLFVIDDGVSLPQQVVFTPPNSAKVSDLRWRDVKIEKDGRLLKFYIDDQYITQLTARSDIQFVAPGKVYLGGTPTVSADTGGLVTSNIDGAITSVISSKFTRPARELVLNFLQFVPSGQEGDIEFIEGGEGSRVTRPPPTQIPIPSPVTFTSGNSAFFLRNALDMRRGGSYSFRFRTSEPRGIISIARGAAQSVNFMAIEIFDGILYFVYDFGTFSSRMQLSDQRMDDGDWHDVRFQVEGNQMLITLDGKQFPTTLPPSEIARLYFYRLYIGGFDDMKNAPWPLYSRQGYKGCLESFKVNDIGVNLHDRFRDSNIQDVEIGCRGSRRRCQVQPCINGFCRDTMNGYVCECSNTPYTGQNCGAEAVIGSWDGTKGTNFEFINREVTHTNDISFRFLTPLRNTLLFKTEVGSNIGDDYIQAELVDGIAKVTFNAGGHRKTLTTGENLNDYFWHTLYIRRRADDVQVWVDDEPPTVSMIGGENYNIKIDRITFGSLGESSNINNYIGYLQNFIYDGRELFGELKRQSSNVIWIEDNRYDNLPLLTYKPMTLTSSETYVNLPTMRIGRTMKLLFKFKTKEANGVILYNTGSGRDAIALELTNGLLRLAYNQGGRNVAKLSGVPYKLNDNQWHTVQVSRNENGQITLRVDSTRDDVSVSDGNGRLDLQSGTLYIGGLPKTMFSRSAVTGLIESRQGFRGCLASIDLNGMVPDLMTFATEKQYILNGCTELDVGCNQPGVCGTGICMPGIDGHSCDCSMTGYIGAACDELPIGYYFGNNSGQGIILYEFPLRYQVDSSEDRIAFGFKTYERNGVLYRLESSVGEEYIEIRLEDGFIKAISKTSSDSQVLEERSRIFSDGQYHVVRFVRLGDRVSLQVDSLKPRVTIIDSGKGLVFDKVYKVILGGRVDAKGVQSQHFFGIIGGANWKANGQDHYWLHMLNKGVVLHGKTPKIDGDVVLTKTYLLYKRPAPVTTPKPPKELFFPPLENLPPAVGGGGVVEDIGGAGGVVPPVVGGPGGELPGGPSLYVPGEPVPLAAALVGPPVPTVAGARAGPIVGTILGTLAFLSSLTWAFYKMKPGIPAFLSPGAASVAGGPVTITAPRATSNLGAVQAASGTGAGGAGSTKLTVVNGTAAGGGAGAGSTTYTSYYSSTSSAVSGGGAGAGSGDAVDSSTLRATGTFSNKGTALGTPKAGRAGMSSSSYSASYQAQSSTAGGYGAGESVDFVGGGGTLGSSYDRQYMTSTSSTHGGLPDYDLPVGSLQPGYSTSTLNTAYNYQVRGNNYNGEGFNTTTIRPKTYTSALTLIVSDPNSRNIRHEIYSPSTHSSANHEYVDRAEDIIIEAPHPSLIVKASNSSQARTEQHANSEYVTIHASDTSSYATYKSTKSETSEFTTNKTTKQSSTVNINELKEVSGTNIGSIFDSNRKSSLQITPQRKSKADGYERLESYASETSVNISSSNLDSWSRDFESEDNLYESTATIASTVRSDSMENTLSSLEEEMDKNFQGRLDLLMQDIEGYSATDRKTSFDSREEVEYSAVNKTKKISGTYDNGYFTQAMQSLPTASEYPVITSTKNHDDTTTMSFISTPEENRETTRSETVIEVQKENIAHKGSVISSSTERAEITEITEKNKTMSLQKPKRKSKESQVKFAVNNNINKKSSNEENIKVQNKDNRITAESSIQLNSDVKELGVDYNKELNKQMEGMMVEMKMDPSKWFELDQSADSNKPADDWTVQNLKTVTLNRQGQYVLSGGSIGAVTPGAAADEVRVDCCLMTNDGRNVVTGSSLGPPQVWDMANGELLRIMKGDTIGSTDLHLVCNDRLLVGAVHADMEINEYSGRKGVFNHTLQIWDFVSGRPLSMAEGEYCSALCPMSDSDKVLFGRTDKFGDATNIIAWDLMGNQMIKQMRYDGPVGNNDYINFLALSKNDRYVVAGFTNSFDNFAEFMVFDMTLTSYEVNEPAMLKLDANPDCTVILPKDEAVTGLRNGDLVIWSIRTGQPSRQLLGSGGAHAHTREVKSVTLSDDGKYVVSASADGTLKVWDMHTERPIHTLTGHTDEVWCSSVSPDNEIVVSGSSDGTIRLWRMKNGSEMCVFNCGVDIFFVTMSHDKGTIVALGDKYGARKLIMLQVVRTKIKKIVSS